MKSPRPQNKPWVPGPVRLQLGGSSCGKRGLGLAVREAVGLGCPKAWGLLAFVGEDQQCSRQCTAKTYPESDITLNVLLDIHGGENSICLCLSQKEPHSGLYIDI